MLTQLLNPLNWVASRRGGGGESKALQAETTSVTDMSKYAPVNNFYSKLITLAERVIFVAGRVRPSQGGVFFSKRLDTLLYGHNNHIEGT